MLSSHDLDWNVPLSFHCFENLIFSMLSTQSSFWFVEITLPRPLLSLARSVQLHLQINGRTCVIISRVTNSEISGSVNTNTPHAVVTPNWNALKLCVGSYMMPRFTLYTKHTLITRLSEVLKPHWINEGWRWPFQIKLTLDVSYWPVDEQQSPLSCTKHLL
jgi:hypothetical protein